MDRMPTDADGPVVPKVAPNAAWEAAADLTSVARTAQAAVDVLESADSPCWSGDAADRYRDVRARLTRRTVQVAELAAAGAGIVLDWLSAAAPSLEQMRGAAARITVVQHRVQVAATLAYDAALDARLQADLDAAYRQWHAALDTYWEATFVAARRLDAVRDVVTDRPLDGRDQAEGAMRSAWEGYAAGPATAVWGLTGLALVDRDRWWQNVSGLPGATVDAVTTVVTHPVDTAEALVDWDAWRNGHLGEAAGTLAVTFVPGPRWLGFGEDVGRIRFAANMAPRRMPKPRLQTVDEMITDGVDLARQEHREYGHALRRHVYVSDDYQMDRLTYGTLLDSGRRGEIPPAASRFTDRATAELTITEALRQNLDAVYSAQHLPIGDEVWIRYRAPHPVGEVMRPTPGGFSIDDGSTVFISVVHGTDGVHIGTAYLEE